MTGYELMKQREAAFKAALEIEMEKITDNYYRDPEHIFKYAFTRGLEVAIEEIVGWEELQEKVLAEVPFANPVEAKREHDNVMNLLGVIKSKLEKKKP